MTGSGESTVYLENLPEQTRVKLEGSAEEELWEQVKHYGIKKFAKENGFKPSNVYNWKNQGLALPVNFLKTLEIDFNQQIDHIKSGSNSKPVKNPQLPWKIDREIFTRTKISTFSNSQKLTVYRAEDPSLIKNFDQKIQKLGQVPTKTRIRENKYELVFPWILRKTIMDQDLATDKNVVIDEKAKVKNGALYLEGSKIENPEVSKMKSLNKKLAAGKLNQEEFSELLASQRKAAQEILKEINN